MKKALKTSGIFVSVILIIGIAGYITISLRGIPTYQPQKIEFKVVSSPESIERGKKLALMLCANCHRNLATGKFTGNLMIDAPPEFGKIYSANITQDKKFGIGEWTDEELVYLFRTGVKRDGKYAPPYMAKMPEMADEDINAIISFLRSNNKMVAADPTPDYPTEPSFLTKFLCTVAFKPLPYPTKPIELPDTTKPIELGKYLAHNLECYSCHSADYKTNNFMTPELSKGYFGGGNKPLNREGLVMVTPNLTPDPETGIGTWSEVKFINAVKYGLVEGQLALRYPMMPFPYLTDAEARSIYQYLQTIPPIKNKVERTAE
jgi:mono/diheme cytochrome c family protein